MVGIFTALASPAFRKDLPTRYFDHRVDGDEDSLIADCSHHNNYFYMWFSLHGLPVAPALEATGSISLLNFNVRFYSTCSITNNSIIFKCQSCTKIYTFADTSTYALTFLVIVTRNLTQAREHRMNADTNPTTATVSGCNRSPLVPTGLIK